MAWCRCALAEAWAQPVYSNGVSVPQEKRAMPASTEISIQGGGEWLLESPGAEHVFTPELLTEEHRLIARTAEEFLDNEVKPATERLELKDWAVARQLLRRCGELGLLGVDIPQAYGGVGLDMVSSLVVSDRFARAASF